MFNIHLNLGNVKSFYILLFGPSFDFAIYNDSK